MTDAKTKFTDMTNAEEIVSSAELRFSEKVCEIGKEICASKSRIVSLSGPTCSGKTTTAQILSNEATSRGKRLHVISIDDFYLDRSTLLLRAGGDASKIDMESVASIDFDALANCVDELLTGFCVHIPKFDFNIGERIGYNSVELSENDLFMFEGIQAIYPEIRTLFSSSALKRGNAESTSIYIEVEDVSLPNGIILPGRTVRLMRRIVRDFRSRNASPDFTLGVWDSVVSNENKSILPNKANCDIFIDSFLNYELSVIKRPLLDTLALVKKEDSCYRVAKELTSIFESIEELPESIVPAASVYHEFIG